MPVFLGTHDSNVVVRRRRTVSYLAGLGEDIPDADGVLASMQTLPGHAELATGARTT